MHVFGPLQKHEAKEDNVYTKGPTCSLVRSLSSVGQVPHKPVELRLLTLSIILALGKTPKPPVCQRQLEMFNEHLKYDIRI
jgi:hypothetical protein